MIIGGLYLGPLATSSKMSTDKYLCGIHAVILESGVGKGRAGILCRQLRARGGTVEPSVSDSTTHLLVGNNVRRSRLSVLLGGAEVPSGVCVVRADWLSSCLARGERLREDEYNVPQTSLDPSPTCSPQKAPSSNSNSPNTAERGRLSGRQEERGEKNTDSSLVGCVGRESEGEEVDDQHCVAERVSVPHNHFLHTSCLSVSFSTLHHHDVGTLARKEHLQTQTVTMLTQVGRKRDNNWPVWTLVPYLL